MLEFLRPNRPFRGHGPLPGAAVVGVALAAALALAPSARAQSQPPGAETLEVFAADCVTPRTSFTLGETICAKVTGGVGTGAPRRFNWVDPGGFVTSISDVTADPQTDSFTLPVSITSVFDNDTVDNRGTWRVNDSDVAEASLHASAFFTVHDPAHIVADLSLDNLIPFADTEATGSSITSSLFVTNRGPDDATGVQLTVPVPDHTSFVSFRQDSGPPFDCANVDGVTTCTIPLLLADARSSLSFVYSVATASPGTQIFSDASVSSATSEREGADNAATASATIVGGGGGSTGCTLTCPGDVAQNNDAGLAGATVTFAPPIAVGTCGTVNCDPASGSFFVIGSEVVTCTTAAGDSCSFTVTIQDDRPIRLSLLGETPMTVECHAGFVDPGVTAVDRFGSTVPVTTTGSVNPNAPGAYEITYTATDGTNTATATRVVNVVDTTPPDLALNGTDPQTLECGSAYADPGATVQDACAGGVTVTVSGDVDPHVRGAYTVVYSATDGTNTADLTRTVEVLDTTPPVITLIGGSPITVQCHSAFNDPGATALDACVGNAVTPIVVTGAVDTGVPGAYVLTYTSSDGTQPGVAHRTVDVVDTTPPAITCPANVVVTLPPNSGATSTAVGFEAASATDECTTATVTASPASGAQFPVGTTTVTATARDASGNTAACTFTVTVDYGFSGFFAPVANPPAINRVNAGRAIPVNFSLSGYKGLAIFAAGSPASGPVACDFTAPVVDVTGTETAGGSSLSYDPSSDQYTYVWKTEKAWAGTCRQLVVALADGTVHRANMSFK